MRLPVISGKEMGKILEKHGFVFVRQSGSHLHYWSEEKLRLVTVPNHPELALGTLLSILKQASLDRGIFERRR
ncbi:MAG: type II toxin-antitoxin system HicA family toxin [Candidatus Aenigmarchaeota archaeon]|nr:type II toxin-antitoxin system HicA family toxin [Candidatus Aenigmarchaeota archaeon]